MYTCPSSITAHHSDRLFRAAVEAKVLLKPALLHFKVLYLGPDAVVAAKEATQSLGALLSSH